MKGLGGRLDVIFILRNKICSNKVLTANFWKHFYFDMRRSRSAKAKSTNQKLGGFGFLSQETFVYILP